MSATIAIGSPLELFRCVPLSCSLTRSACGMKHESHGAKGGRDRMGVVGTPSGACSRCAIGAAHLRGEEPAAWPDGAPLELAARSRWTTAAEVGTNAVEAKAKGETVEAKKGKTVEAKSNGTISSSREKVCAECDAPIDPASMRSKFCSKKCSKRQSNRKFNTKRGPRTPQTTAPPQKRPPIRLSPKPGAAEAKPADPAVESVVTDSEIWKVVRNLRSAEGRLVRDLGKVREALAVLTGAGA